MISDFEISVISEISNGISGRVYEIWQQLVTPWYGYFPNGTAWLVVKEDAVDTAREMFNGSNIHITTEGHHYLGSVGSEAFEQQFL